MNFDDFPDHGVLEILKRVNTWSALEYLCSTNQRLNDICKNNKDILVANVLFNKYKNVALERQQCWEFGDNASIFEELIRLGVDVTIHENYPVQQAAESGFVNVLRVLHQNGADIHTQEDLPLRRAARHGHLNVVMYLLEHDANTYENHQIYNVLIQAILSGNVDLVEYLHTTVGMNINVEIGVEIAAEEGDFDMIAYLLENGANATGDALIAAVGIDDTDIVELLLEYGADVHTRNDKSIVLASKEASFETLELLLDYGADPNARNSRPLMHSIRNGSVQNLELLLQYGADIHAEEADALVTAAVDGGESVLEWLIERGVNVQQNGYDALIGAVEHGLFDIVKRLMRAGADISVNNYEALYTAIESDDIHVVKAIIRNTDIDAIPMEILLEARYRAEGYDDIYYFLDQYIEESE